MKHVKNIDELIKQYHDDPLELLKALNAFYECPKDENGNRTGPLVAYAGKYETPEGKKNFVGDVYVNFSVAEQYPEIIFHFANQLGDHHDMKMILDHATCIVGPQMGGISLGQMFAFVAGKRFAYLEKEVLQAKSEDQREDSRLVFLRHQIRKDDKVIIIEDVLNNFSTTKEAIALVKKAGGEVVGIGGFLNRSLEFNHAYHYRGSHQRIPIATLVRKEIMEWQQSDANVKNDIANKNIVWKPKNEWDRLTKAMEEAIVT